MHNPETQLLTLSDNRKLAYAFYGSTSSSTNYFYFHGFPGAHVEATTWHDVAVKNDTRIIAVTRPGFAESSTLPNRTILDWPKDVLSLADHLEVTRFGVMGASGGGPYVFACLKEIPRDRLIAAGVVCGMYPSTLGLSGMGMSGRVIFNISPWLPGLMSWLMNWQFSKMKALDDAPKDENQTGPAGIQAMMGQEMKQRPLVDQEVWATNEGGMREALLASLRAILKSENIGQALAQEATLFGSPWGFELADLQVEKGRLVLWHGTEDNNVPLRMAKESAEMLGDRAELKVYEGEGHLSLVRKADEIMKVLKEMMV